MRTTVVQPPAPEPPGILNPGVQVRLRQMLRYWPLALLVLGAAMAATLHFTDKLPPVYTSEAVLYVKRRPTDTLSEEPDPEALQGGSFLDVHLALLRSRDVLESAGLRLLDLGLMPLPEDFTVPGEPDLERQERAAFYARSKVGNLLEVQPARNSNIIRLTFRADDGERAAAGLQVIIDEYQARYRSANNLEPIRALWESELAESESEWEAAQQERADFVETHEIHSLEEQIEEVTRIQEALASRLREAEGRRQDLQVIVARTRTEWEAEPEWFEREATVQPNPQRVLLDLRVEELQTLQARWAPGSSRYRELQQQIDEEDERRMQMPPTLETPVASERNQTHQALLSLLTVKKLELDEAQLEIDRLGRELETCRSRVSQLRGHREELAGMDERLTAAEDLVKQRQSRVANIARTQQLEESELLWSTKVLQEPTIPAMASTAKATKIKAAGAGAGLFLAAAVALMGAFLTRKLRYPIEVKEITGAVPLAVLPKVKGLASMVEDPEKFAALDRGPGRRGKWLLSMDAVAGHLSEGVQPGSAREVLVVGLDAKADHHSVAAGLCAALKVVGGQVPLSSSSQRDPERKARLHCRVRLAKESPFSVEVMQQAREADDVILVVHSGRTGRAALKAVAQRLAPADSSSRLGVLFARS